MQLPSRHQLREATGVVRRFVRETPLVPHDAASRATGGEVWIKREDFAPTGSFKVRGGLFYCHGLSRRTEPPLELIAATRGNHGASIAFSAASFGFRSTLVVPRANSPAKNNLMRANGAELVEAGADFQDAFEHAQTLAGDRGAHFVPSFDDALVRGVGSYGLELFSSRPAFDRIYVPIGLGSGICGVIAAREAMGLTSEIVGVVAAAAPAYRQSFEARKPLSAEVSATLADGLACRKPDPTALSVILRYVSAVVEVSELDLRHAMKLLWTTSSWRSEGAGAAGLAAILKDRAAVEGRCVATVLSGRNIERRVFNDAVGGENEGARPSDGAGA